MTAISKWEVIRGLPGDGPTPLHFHCGHPTPWTGGFVVKFLSADHSEWVGNFQKGIVGFDTLVDWPEAELLVVVANGAIYFVSKTNPATYSTHRLQSVQALLFDPSRDLLFVADYGDVTAYRRDRTIAWQQEGLGLPGIALNMCTDGVLAIEVEFEMGEPWASITLAVSDGSILDAPRDFRRAPGPVRKAITAIKDFFPGAHAKK